MGWLTFAKAAWAWLWSPTGRAFLLMAALLGALWWFRSSVRERAIEETDGKHAVAQAEAARQLRAAEIARDNLANAIADRTAERAREVSQEEQGRAQASAERVRTIVRTIEPNCPVRVPDQAWGEINDMVSRANEAQASRKQRRAR